MGCKEVLIQNFATFTLVLGLVLGVTIGMTLNVIHPAKYTKREIMYVKLPGELFLRTMKAVSLPIVAACIVYSVGSTYIPLLKRLGYQYGIYILVTQLESAMLAACFGMLFLPGKALETTVKHKVDTKSQLTIPDIWMDAIRNLFPVNLLEVTIRYYKTRLVNTHNNTFDELDKWKILPEDRTMYTPNLLGLASMSVIIGLTLNVIKQEGQYFLSLIKCVTKATMIITMWALWFAPFCTVFLTAEHIVTRKATMQYLTEMSTFIALYFTVLTVQMIVYALTYLVFVRENPLKFFWNISESLVLAASSGRVYVSFPYGMLSMQKKMHLDNRIVDFVTPIGTLLHKDGTTIFIVLGVMFISELNNNHMGFGTLCTVILLGVMGIMDTSGSSSSDVALIETILLSCDIPAAGLHTLAAVDWICIRYRAMVNICGHSVAVCVLSHINRRLIEEFPETDNPQ